MDRSRKRALAAAVVAACALFAFVLVRKAQVSKTPELRFAYAWTSGKAYVYDVAWHSRDLSPVGGSEPLETSIDLEGELRLRAVAHEGGTYALRVGLRNLRRHNLTLLGKVTPLDDKAAAEAFEGQEAEVVAASTGRVEKIVYPAESPALFRSVLQALVTEMAIVVPSSSDRTPVGTRWSATEPTSRGNARVDYTVTQLEPPTLERQRVALDALAHLSEATAKLSSTGRATLDPQGHLRTLTQDDAFSVASTGAGPKTASSGESTLRVAFNRIEDAASESVAAIPLEHAETRQAGDTIDGAGSRDAMLTRRAAGMTIDALTSDLLRYGAGGQMPDHSRWLWRATGLLKLHPALCEKLSAVFDDARTGAAGRALVLDLLAATGHSKAQSVMRSILSGHTAKGERAYVVLLQRFTLVEHPDDETLAFLEARYLGSSGTDPQRLASAYALGAAAGRAARDGNASAARALSARLRRDLTEAKDPRERAALVAAVGNEQADDSASVLGPFVNDEAQGVRRAVASALESSHTKAADDALLGLVRDSTFDVQETALASLGTRSLTTDQVRNLADAAMAGPFKKRNDALLVTILTRAPLDAENVGPMLDELLARNADKPELLGRIAKLMARREGRGT